MGGSRQVIIRTASEDASAGYVWQYRRRRSCRVGSASGARLTEQGFAGIGVAVEQVVGQRRQ